MGQRILLIDDDLSLQEPLTALLSDERYEVSWAQTGEDALDIVSREPIDLALLDIRLGPENGLDLLPHLKKLSPEMSVIILTIKGAVENVVQAMKRGADNFIVKPINPPEFLAVVSKGLESCLLRRKQMGIERWAAQYRSMIFSPEGALSRVLARVESVAERDTTVLLLGEMGTGKGLLARMIHNASARQDGPFVTLTCAGLQPDLTQSELFGHERGAFTGAVERKTGLFEAARGGTLFLDDIGEMDPAVQAKLLNVLEQKRFRRVGGITEIQADVRLLAATNRDLIQEVADGRFRADLFHRLNAFPIELPPLRDRPEDILRLAVHFLGEFRGAQATTSGISRAATDLLLGYDWPGNVRELRNMIERASILCPSGSEILPVHLPSLGTRPGSSAETACQAQYAASSLGFSSVPMSLAEVERRHLETVLQSHNWNVTVAAQVLGISRDTLHRKIKKYNLTEA